MRWIVTGDDLTTAGPAPRRRRRVSTTAIYRRGSNPRPAYTRQRGDKHRREKKYRQLHKIIREDFNSFEIIRVNSAAV